MAQTHSNDTSTFELLYQLPHVKHCIRKLSSISWTAGPVIFARGENGCTDSNHSECGNDELFYRHCVCTVIIIIICNILYLCFTITIRKCTRINGNSRKLWLPMTSEVGVECALTLTLRSVHEKTANEAIQSFLASLDSTCRLQFVGKSYSKGYSVSWR